MDTYIITAKTVEEAIRSAKKQYEDENHEVSYEILEMPKKGIFGIGAKDAKIKITVTKTEKVELGSLVAEMRSMKNLTSRDDDAEKQKKKPDQPKPQPRQPQQKPQPKPAPSAQTAQPAAPQPKQPRPAPSQPKPQQPKPTGEKPAQNPQPKQPKPADKPTQNPQPKPTKPVEKPAEKIAEKLIEKPMEKIAEKPAEKSAEKIVEKIAEAQPVKIDAPAPAENAEKQPAPAPKFGDAGEEYKSSLHNSGRPNRRTQQKHIAAADNADKGAAVTVSQPMGLSDFVADPNAQGFGKEAADQKSGRMSNDVRKKKKPAPKTDAARKPEGDAFAAKYDFAESDDDYEKLNRLVRESDDELESAEAALLVPRTPAPSAEAAEAAEAAESEEEAVEEDEELAPIHETRRREAITQTEMDYALAFANTLLADMKLNAHAVPAACPEGEEFDVTEEADVYPKINIVGEDTGILIGHHGETLDSIQYLVNLSALRKTKSKDGDYVKIVVDIENYREKREETLRTLARRMASRAVKYKRNVFLEPMNAYERRIIHSELQSFENVSTHSVGADRNRKIIITYEGPDKQPDNRSSANRKKRGERGNNPVEGGEAPAAESASGNPANGGKSRRRPRKSQKMPIEKLGELLPGGEEAQSAAAEASVEAAETAMEAAAEAAVEAVETAEAAVAAEAAESADAE